MLCGHCIPGRITKARQNTETYRCDHPLCRRFHWVDCKGRTRVTEHKPPNWEARLLKSRRRRKILELADPANIKKCNKLMDQVEKLEGQTQTAKIQIRELFRNIKNL